MNWLYKIVNYNKINNQLASLRKQCEQYRNEITTLTAQLKAYHKSIATHKPYTSKNTELLLLKEAHKLIKRVSNDYQIDACLIEAISEHESSMRMFALRYESHLKDNIYFREHMDEHGKDPDLPWHSCSYGLMQILYWNMVAKLPASIKALPAYELVGMPDLTLQLAVEHFKELLTKYRDIEEAVSAYNAGEPTHKNYKNYVKPIVDKYTELKGYA